MKKSLCLGFALLFVLCCGCGQKADYYAILAETADFDYDGAQDVTFTYDFSDPVLIELDETWGLREIAGEGDTLPRALHLMRWLRAHTNKVSKSKFRGSLNAAEILFFAFDNKRVGLNCKQYSAAFSEMLMAVGIKAKAMWCYPAVDEDENHVVVRVYLPEESRWVMLDPSFDLCVMDETGRILDAWELRQRLAGRAPLRLNEGFVYRGTQQDYFDYMAKDMCYFTCRKDTRFGGNEMGQVVYLLPADTTVGGEALIATYESFWR